MLISKGGDRPEVENSAVVAEREHKGVVMATALSHKKVAFSCSKLLQYFLHSLVTDGGIVEISVRQTWSQTR